MEVVHKTRGSIGETMERREGGIQRKRVAVLFDLDASPSHPYQAAHIVGEDGCLTSFNIGDAPNPSAVGECTYYTRGYCLPLVCSSYVPSLVQLQINKPGKYVPSLVQLQINQPGKWKERVLDTGGALISVIANARKGRSSTRVVAKQSNNTTSHLHFNWPFCSQKFSSSVLSILATHFSREAPTCEETSCSDSPVEN
ncbi:unnamed protein product [Thlaspi arvense]|uniref:Uncharacterized protein n=1 Tax=Thlaspi arvense TaxID=13288 RepID=A0AAU9S030_THLAR|nr:unnamed protein product [Thlaspi arvense]